MADDTHFGLVEPALRKGLEMINKYYNLTDRSAASIVCLGMFLRYIVAFILIALFSSRSYNEG